VANLKTEFMKKLLFSLFVFVGLAKTSSADVGTGTPFQAGDAHVVVIKDSIAADAHWTSNNVYILQGWVYVVNSATVTIDAGTIIVGDKNSKGSLIFERGTKIKAMGTKELPIVFTSNEAEYSRNYGDWGGIILCGKAPVNWTAGQAQVEGGPRSFYGGNDAHDNSGEMHYVRIEFAGIAYQTDQEINGLTLCGVGDATQLDHIQVSYSGDDSYEWFGGTVNGKYLVSLGCWDDDFDTDCGYNGKNQFCVAIRDAGGADQSGSKAFESDAYQAGTATGLGGDTSQITKPVFSNVTALGPIDNQSVAPLAEFTAGAQIRRGSGLSILNSVIAGWPCGLLIDQSSSAFGKTTDNIGTNLLQFRNNIIAGTATYSTPNPKDIVFVINGARSLTPTTAQADSTTGSPFAPYAGPWTWLKASSNHNMILGSLNSTLKLHNPFPGNPLFIDLTPNTSSPICYNAAHPFNVNNPINLDTTGNYANYNAPAAYPDFVTSKANDAFFDKVNFIGAFPGTQTTSDNWMKGWTNLAPNSTFYVPVGVSNVAKSFSSANVYPNPATNKAVLTLDLLNNANISIALFDVTGKKVQNVFNGQKTTGKQYFEINVSELNTGLYFVTVSTGDNIKTVKLNVIK
jgi:hypothetical protein